MDEHEDEQVIRGTFSQVATWHRTPLFVPAVGSELRTDDSEWRYQPLSQMAKSGLDVAAEHLYAVRVLIDAGQLFPFGHRALIRTALLGATYAVWLLDPSDPYERARRHRVFVEMVYRRHLQYLEELLTLATDEDSQEWRNTCTVQRHLSSRKDELDALRASKGEKARWEDTSAIAEAARATFGTQQNVDELVKEALLAWRIGSGAAHGLVWSVLGQPGTSAAAGPDAEGMAVFHAEGTFSAIANSYMLVYWMTTYGWGLLRRRGL